MKTVAVFFPFDLFGSGSGGADGVHLLADALREILADNKKETSPTRAAAYTRNVIVDDLPLESLEELSTWRHTARLAANEAWSKNRSLLFCSGNHLGVLPVYEEFARLPGRSLVIQLDAHLDIQHFDECSQAPSHGNFLLHAESKLPPLINVGHRDLLLPKDYSARHFQGIYPAAQIAAESSTVCQELIAAAAQADRILIDIDCDVFDPAYFPGVAHPVPFGLSPHQVLGLIASIPKRSIKGLCLSEFSPGYDRDDRSLATLAWLIEWWLLRIYEK